MVAEMEAIEWLPDEEITVEAYQQWGMAYDMLGEREAAVERYEAALDVLTRLTQRTVQLHYRRGQVYVQQGLSMAAREAAHLARYETERLQGTIAFFTGDFPQAGVCFERALQMAQMLELEAKMAEAHRWLMLNAGQQMQLEQAQAHAEMAMAYAERIGDQFQVAGIRADMAGCIFR